MLGRAVVAGFLRRCCELGDVKTVGEISFKKLTQVASCLRLTAPDNQQNISAALVKGEHNGRWCSSTANISFVAESWHRLTIKKKMLHPLCRPCATKSVKKTGVHGGGRYRHGPIARLGLKQQ